MPMLTVRQIDRADKEWLKHEAERQQLSMEELVRRLIREHRLSSMERTPPSAIVRRYFGPQGGIDLGERKQFSFDAPDLQPDLQKVLQDPDAP